MMLVSAGISLPEDLMFVLRSYVASQASRTKAMDGFAAPLPTSGVADEVVQNEALREAKRLGDQMSKAKQEQGDQFRQWLKARTFYSIHKVNESIRIARNWNVVIAASQQNPDLKYKEALQEIKRAEGQLTFAGLIREAVTEGLREAVPETLKEELVDEQPGSAKTTLRTDLESLKAVEDLADQLGVSFSAVVRHFILTYLERHLSHVPSMEGLVGV